MVTFGEEGDKKMAHFMEESMDGHKQEGSEKMLAIFVVCIQECGRHMICSLSIDRDGLMTGFKFSVPWASSVESLLIRVLQAIVNKDHRKCSKYLSQEDVGDLLYGHGTRTLQVPAVWSGIAEP